MVGNFVLSEHVPPAVWAHICVADRIPAGDYCAASHAAILFTDHQFVGDNADDDENDGQSTTDKDHRYNEIRGSITHEKIYQ